MDGALHDGLINEQFAAVLKEALERNPNVSKQLDAAAASVDEGESDHGRAALEVLQSALVTTRHTVTRLMGLQSTLEAEIATAQKQMERMAFLYEKIQRDYAYLHTVEKLYSQEKAKEHK